MGGSRRKRNRYSQRFCCAAGWDFEEEEETAGLLLEAGHHETYSKYKFLTVCSGLGEEAEVNVMSHIGYSP
jgi:hypothetical protein